MKNTLVAVLIVGIVGFGGYKVTRAACDEPLEYSIGTFSTDFGISQTDFKNKVSAAETVWEGVMGRQLFVYNSEAKFKINLIYDERQKQVEAKRKTEFGLDATESKFRQEDISFSNIKSNYENQVSLHEAKLKQLEVDSKKYEADVAYWNSKGGAPKAEYEKLEQQRASLNNKTREVNNEVATLNEMVKKVNAALVARNQAAEKYNDMARDYNNEFGGGLEFDQAEYTGNAINVYEFKSDADLKVALAHELGHALGMDHTENAKSIMYYLSGEQTATPTAEDIAELKRACSANPLLDKLSKALANLSATISGSL